MKKQLVVTIEEELIPQWKAEARAQGISLSHLIEKRMGNGTAKKVKRFSEFFKDIPDLEPTKSADDLKDEYLMEKYS
jgi:hypothetical protein